jgi:hypothetical protein
LRKGFIALGDAPAQALPAGDLPAEFAHLMTLRQRLKNQAGAGLTAAECNALLGSLTMSAEQKQAKVVALCRDEPSAEQAVLFDRCRPVFLIDRAPVQRLPLPGSA